MPQIWPRVNASRRAKDDMAKRAHAASDARLGCVKRGRVRSAQGTRMPWTHLARAVLKPVGLGTCNGGPELVGGNLARRQFRIRRYSNMTCYVWHPHSAILNFSRPPHPLGTKLTDESFRQETIFCSSLDMFLSTLNFGGKGCQAKLKLSFAGCCPRVTM